MLSAWFDVGFLELRGGSPGTPRRRLLEKLIDYESVHAIQSWQDLKHRLADDRRCFAFFHPNMPGEPLIFVEVASGQRHREPMFSCLLDESLPEQDPSHRRYGDLLLDLELSARLGRRELRQLS